MASCRFRAKGEARVLPDRHLDDCSNDDCKSCLPCPESHCCVCDRKHLKPDQQTCPDCVYDVREYLYAIVRLYGELRYQAMHGSNMTGHLLAGAPIPGGDAMVMLAGGGSEQIQRQLVARGHVTGAHLEDDEQPGDPESIEHVLASHEDDWRLLRTDPAAGLPSIESACAYLHEHLHWAAQQHPDFADFAKHMRRTVRRLQSVLDDRDPTVRGVQCLSEECDGDLKQHFNDPDLSNPKDQGGRRDYWQCTRCDRLYHDREYRLAVKQAHDDVDPWRTAGQLSEMYGISKASIWQWRRRGYLTKFKDAGNGRRMMYDKDEVRLCAMRGEAK